MRPPTKLQVFAIVLPPKMLQHIITPLPPVPSRFITTRLFSVPQVEMKLKGLHFADVAEIQEAVTDELSPKRGIFGSFSENVLSRKSLYMCQWRI
jgi:hypothetical protein